MFSGTHLRWSESSDIDETTTQRDLVEKADREILSGRPIVFRVRHMTPGGGSNHFVLGIGKCGGNYIIVDPGDSNREVFNPNDPDFTLLGVRLFTAQ